MARQDVVKKMAKYEDFFVNVMMVEELGLQVPSPDDDIVKEGTYPCFAYPAIKLFQSEGPPCLGLFRTRSHMHGSLDLATISHPHQHV
jgi:hypothetical protein